MLEQHELFEMIINNNNKDILTMIESDNQNLSFKILKNMYIEKGLNINENEFENNLDLFNLDGKYNYMAYLLADINNISIKVVTFKGYDKTEMLRRNEYGNKCLLLAIDQVLSYIESINDINVEITNHKRIDNPLFYMASFREAWMNACLHSRWDRRVPPVVYIYSNRLEIVSIGGLPTDLSVEKFYRGTSRAVNEKLLKIFGQLVFVEQTCHGVPVIVNKYGKETFDIDSDFITVTIPFSRNINMNSGLNKIEISDLNKSQNKVLQYVSINRNASISDIANYMGVSEIYIKKILFELKKHGYIERIGSNRNGSWKVLK